MMDRSIKILFKFSLIIPALCLSFMVSCNNGNTKLHKKSNDITNIVNQLGKMSLAELADVDKYSEQFLMVSKEYKDVLSEVNKDVVNTIGVKNMFEMQGEIVQLYSDNYNKFNSNLDTESLNVYQGGLKKALIESLKETQSLDTVITADFAKTTDAERMSVISDIEKRMKYNYDGANAVVNTYKRMYNHVEFQKGTKDYIK